MFSFFKKKETPVETPKCLGLGIGHSFEIDSLFLRLISPELVIEEAATTYIISAVGVVEIEGTTMYRFYTDDDAFLQIVAQGGTSAEHVLDVKLFHYYQTRDMSHKPSWESLLNEKLGTPEYALEGHTYQRVWESDADYHQPVHMRETTYDKEGATSTTDQFTMLFERPISHDTTESLFLSAEESLSHDNIERCFVLSTGITLTPTQITLHG